MPPLTARKSTSLESRVRSALAVLFDSDDALRLERALDIASPNEYSDAGGRIIRASRTHYLADLLREVLDVVTTDQIAAWLDVIDPETGNVVGDVLPATAPGVKPHLHFDAAWRNAPAGVKAGDVIGTTPTTADREAEVHALLHTTRYPLNDHALHVNPVGPSDDRRAAYTLHVQLPIEVADILRGHDRWRSTLYLEYTPLLAQKPAAPVADDVADATAVFEVAIDDVPDVRPCPACEGDLEEYHRPGCAAHIRNLTAHAVRRTPEIDAKLQAASDAGFPLVTDAVVTETEHGLHLQGHWTQEAMDVITGGRITGSVDADESGLRFTAHPDAVASFVDAGYVAAEATALAASLYLVDPTSLAARRVLLDARHHMEANTRNLRSALGSIADDETTARLDVIISVWQHRLEHTLPEPHRTEVRSAIIDTRDALLQAASLLNAL